MCVVIGAAAFSEIFPPKPCLHYDIAEFLLVRVAECVTPLSTSRYWSGQLSMHADNYTTESAGCPAQGYLSGKLVWMYGTWVIIVP
jgi:hypothetical protein